MPNRVTTECQPGDLRWQADDVAEEAASPELAVTVPQDHDAAPLPLKSGLINEVQDPREREHDRPLLARLTEGVARQVGDTGRTHPDGVETIVKPLTIGGKPVRPHVEKYRRGLTGHAVLRRFAGLIVIAAIGLIVAGCNSQEGTAFDDQNYSPTSGGAFDSTTLKTTDPRSLFVGSNYRKAFKLAEQKLGARAEIEAAVLHPGQLALTVISHGKQLSVAVQYNGEYGSKPGGALAGTPTTFRLTRLAGDTPATLARRIASETRLPITQLHSMIVSRIPHTSGLYWMVYTAKPSIYFTAPSAQGPIQEQRPTSEPIRLR